MSMAVSAVGRGFATPVIRRPRPRIVGAAPPAGDYRAGGRWAATVFATVCGCPHRLVCSGGFRGQAMDPVTSDTEATRRLLDQVRTGDRPALDRLLAEHRPYLHRLVELRFDPQL